VQDWNFGCLYLLVAESVELDFLQDASRDTNEQVFHILHVEKKNFFFEVRPARSNLTI